nr:hypothetical protein [Tanacetum cinerariifolium]
MVKLVEDKLKESKFSYHQPRPLLSNLISSVSNTTTTQAPNPPIFSKPPTTNYRIRRLSHAEQQTLVDSGSSHNSVQPRIAKFLHLPVLVVPKYFVLVGNSSSLQHMGLCKDIPLFLQTASFMVSCYLLDIHGADIFLGIGWLSTSGTIVAEFSIPMMQFIHGSGWITLTGASTNTPTQASFSQLCRLFDTGSVVSCHALTMSVNKENAQAPTRAADVSLCGVYL